MGLKRKASFSLSPSPSISAVSPRQDQSSPFQPLKAPGDHPYSATNGSSGTEPASSPVSDFWEAAPSDFNPRTRKRFRNSRPDEETIHQNTLSKLFSAQRQHHNRSEAGPATNTHAYGHDRQGSASSMSSAHYRLESNASLISGPTQLKQQEKVAAQRSLDGFFSTNGSRKTSHSSLVESNTTFYPPGPPLWHTSQASGEATLQPVSILTCEDCYAPLLTATTRNAVDIDMMDVEGPLVECEIDGGWECERSLGHVRLEINDLSPTGAQPLHDKEDTVHAVVNGEIYEYERLRADMIKKLDYSFRGRSDCELVLALYKYYGFSFVSHLRGEFSLCLYDSQRDLFIAVRDRYGIKPLFWTIVDDELLVAAEMKAFLPLGWTPEWDIKSIVDGSFQIGAGTIFRGVQTVRPGHMLVCRHFGTVQEQQYWDMDFPDKSLKETRTEIEMVEGVRARLLDAIRVRLRADVKVGVALSGGIDSSVVAGMVNHLIREGEQVGSDKVTERLSCFGIAFDVDSGFDESVTANRTADFLGVKFYKKHMDEAALADRFEDATWLDEQPNPDLNFIGLFALSELVREQGFRVILNGQGSDEIFGGYNIFLADYLREPDRTFTSLALPDSIRHKELSKAEQRVEENYPGGLNTTSSLTRRLLNDTLTPAQMVAAFPRLPFQSSLLRHQPDQPDAQLTYPESILPTVLAKISKKWHPLHTAQYIFCKAHLENLLLSNLGDRGEMAHSIEGRTPFLDHHFTEYVNGLPPSLKIRASETPGESNGVGKAPVEFVEKYILREAARPFVTEEIYRKRKHPYSAPLQYPIDGPLHGLMKKLVTERNVRELGFLDWESSRLGGRTLGDMVDLAFKARDKSVFTLVICVAQWVVLMQRFGVKSAETMANGL